VRAQTRHRLKQDAFSRATYGVAEQTAHWSVAHQNTLIFGGIAAAVIIAIVAGGWYYQSQQDLKASFELTQATRTLEAPLRPAGVPAQPDAPSFASAKERAEAAQKQFRAIVVNYPHTRTADMARYFLGVTATSMGDNAAAESSFKWVAANASKQLASVAKLALAGLYSNTNRSKEAETLYKDMIAHPTTVVSQVTAELQLAGLYQSSNQPLDAKRLYEEIKKDSPGTEAGQFATQKLAELK
jgi:tetratricopeptide (TPR) repeat protein